MEKQIRIALAGNPNCGKTTLFNALTGSNQFVGNWPGVTVEKKEGKLKKHDDVIIMDLPGIYSLSPYTLEEVVARNYLITERPDAILNIIDGTNLERNLYLTTQLTELGIPVVVAINMMDVVKKNGDSINTQELARELGLPVIVHEREAHEDGLSMIKEFPEVTGVFHCFSGSAELAKQLVSRGWFLGFTGVLTFKNARRALEAVAVLPRDRVVIETDCPYMAPEPFRGKRNDPRNLYRMAEVLAQLWQVSPQEAQAITYENGRRLYRMNKE